MIRRQSGMEGTVTICSSTSLKLADARVSFSRRWRLGGGGLVLFLLRSAWRVTSSPNCELPGSATLPSRGRRHTYELSVGVVAARRSIWSFRGSGKSSSQQSTDRRRLPVAMNEQMGSRWFGGWRFRCKTSQAGRWAGPDSWKGGGDRTDQGDKDWGCKVSEPTEGSVQRQAYVLRTPRGLRGRTQRRERWALLSCLPPHFPGVGRRAATSIQPITCASG